MSFGKMQITWPHPRASGIRISWSGAQGRSWEIINLSVRGIRKCWISGFGHTVISLPPEHLELIRRKAQGLYCDYSQGTAPRVAAETYFPVEAGQHSPWTICRVGLLPRTSTQEAAFRLGLVVFVCICVCVCAHMCACEYVYVRRGSEGHIHGCCILVFTPIILGTGLVFW